MGNRSNCAMPVWLSTVEYSFLCSTSVSHNEFAHNSHSAQTVSSDIHEITTFAFSKQAFDKMIVPGKGRKPSMITICKAYKTILQVKS